MLARHRFQETGNADARLLKTATWLNDCSLNHPWLRNAVYFGPALFALAGGVSWAVIAPEETVRITVCFVLGGLWSLAGCNQVRKDKQRYEATYGNEANFRYC